MNEAKVILVLVGSVLVEIAQEIITYIAEKYKFCFAKAS